MLILIRGTVLHSHPSEFKGDELICNAQFSEFLWWLGRDLSSSPWYSTRMVQHGAMCIILCITGAIMSSHQKVTYRSKKCKT